MTIEQAIEHAEDIAISAIGCECREEHRQLAAWLRELQARRKQPEIVRCGECKHSITYNGVKYVCCEMHNTYPNENYFCGDAERRNDGKAT